MVNTVCAFFASKQICVDYIEMQKFIDYAEKRPFMNIFLYIILTFFIWYKYRKRALNGHFSIKSVHFYINGYFSRQFIHFGWGRILLFS